MGRKIGILGGTFNPAHIGHLLLSESAKETYELDEVWMIPTGCSYLKNGSVDVSPEERYQMTSLAVEDLSDVKCLDMEKKYKGADSSLFDTSKCSHIY